MYNQGVAGAFWSAVRRLRSALAGFRPAAAVLAAGAFVGAIPKAGASPIEYDYTGNAFTSVTCQFGAGESCTSLLTTSNRLSGNIVVDGGLPASSLLYTTNLSVKSFSFTDGVNTISSSEPGATFEGGFITDAAGQIIRGAAIAVLDPPQPNGVFDLVMIAGEGYGDLVQYYRNHPGSSFEYNSATNSTPGTWTVASTPPPPPQIVYLDFGADPGAVYKDQNSISPISYSKLDAGISQSDIADITNLVSSIYSPYNVNYVTAPPSSGAYDTIYIGGAPDQYAQYLPAPVVNYLDANNILGMAANINFGNRIDRDTAVVFSGLPFFGAAQSATCVLLNITGYTCDPSADDRLAQVIAHETGHILGLVHVTDSSQLMYIRARQSPTIIGGAAPIWEQRDPSPANPDVLLENSSAILGCNLGFRATGLTDCITVASQGIYGGPGNAALRFSTASQLLPLYDATLFDEQSNADPDTGPLAYFLGTILPGMNEVINIPAMPGDKLFVEGSLTEGGPLEILQGNYIPGANGGTFSLPNPILTSVSEPSSIAIFFVGIWGLLWLKNGNGWRELLSCRHYSRCYL